MKRQWMCLLVLDLVLIANSTISPNNDKHGSILGCKNVVDNGLKVFEVLPGMGWDNLQNVEKGQIAFFNYSKCQVTKDRVYLVPDQVDVIPVKESNIDKFANVIETMQQYTSVTSKSINKATSVNFLFVSASYSSEYRRTKLHKMEYRGQSSTFRVQARYLRYRTVLQQGLFLHADFKKRVRNVAEQLLTGDRQSAIYLSQLIIRDYGTHIITSSDAGGLIAKEDEVIFASKEESEKETQSLKVSSAIHFSFLFGLIQAGAKHEHSSRSSNESVKGYLNRVQNSHVKTTGGVDYRLQHFSINDWLSKLDNNLVTLDRRGDPLYTLISESNFKELPKIVLPDLQNVLKRAYEMYHKSNIYYGCINMTSDYFDARANVDDNTCFASKAKYSFGGTFQVCQMVQSANGDICGSRTLVNYFTGRTACPDGFQPTQIHEDLIQLSHPKRICIRVWFMGFQCREVIHISSAIIKSFWCGTKSGANNFPSYKFGGIYSFFRVNPLTNAQSCPSGYFPSTIVDDVTFCVTNDETLPDMDVSFGGMFSCKFGNGIAYGKKKCPNGFSQHIVKFETYCDIVVCLRYENFFGKTQSIPTIQHPPFTRKPPGRQTLGHVVVIDNDRNWFKDWKAFDKMADDNDLYENINANMSFLARTYNHVQRLVNMTVNYFS